MEFLALKWAVTAKCSDCLYGGEFTVITAIDGGAPRKSVKKPAQYMGHLGIERTLDLARTRFYWPKMAMAVEEEIKTCESCVKRKTPPERAAPLVNISTRRPL